MTSRHSATLAALLACAAMVTLSPGRATADPSPTWGLQSFSTSASTTQAGAHANFSSSFSVTTDALGNPVDQLKDAQVTLPPGVIGDPEAIPRCPNVLFQTLRCPPSTQVGVIRPSLLVGCPGVSTTLVEPPAATRLTEPTSFGDEQLTVESTAGIHQFDQLTIGEGEEARTDAVAAVVDATHLKLQNALFAADPAATRVFDDELTVAGTNGFCAGERGAITVGQGEHAEQAQIASITDSTHLALEGPLVREHAAGETVTHIAAPVSGPIPLFNLEPSGGHVATLGASLFLTDILVQVDLHAGSPSVGLTTTIENLSTALTVEGTGVELWGVPGDPSHDSLRCGELGLECGPLSSPPTAFMTLPTQCTTPLATSVRVDSWQHPGQYAEARSAQPAPTGCEHLSVTPQISVTPDTHTADSPAGYTIDLTVPQNENPEALATPTLRNVTVTLPLGTSISPPGAAGVVGCTQAQFQIDQCPSRAAIGSVDVHSPLLADPLTGHVFLAAPTPGHTYRVLLSAAGDNATIHLVGDIEPDPATGQLTIVFADNPQFPFSDLRTTFYGGPSAPLANPATCGTATTTAQAAAYSGQTESMESAFMVSADDGGGTCSASQAFAPVFTAGTIAPIAGAFTPFTLSISRPDQQQALSRLAVNLPAGVLGEISSVEPCPDQQAAAGTCPASSSVGSVTVGSGAGSSPLYLTGQVYLTGPYAGAPFGLAIVVPAAAGPFNLGTIVVRARVLIDAGDLHLTVASDPLPQILEGIPLRLRSIRLTLGRPGFVFNPTACGRQTITGQLTSAQGTSAAVSAPFQIAGCSSLAFAPRLQARTAAPASRRGNGAALTVELSESVAHAASLRAVTVTLPRALAPRLSTIQGACPAGDLARPEACPATALVGEVTVVAPALRAPLHGPLYLVARAGRQYPALVMLLDSQGITVRLTGDVDISSSGRISASFSALPDVPVSRLRLELPQGPHSMLGAIQPLCARRLVMPYSLTAQNGAQLTRTAAVSVIGCHGHRRTRRGGRR